MGRNIARHVDFAAILLTVFIKINSALRIRFRNGVVVRCQKDAESALGDLLGCQEIRLVPNVDISLRMFAGALLNGMLKYTARIMLPQKRTMGKT